MVSTQSNVWHCTILLHVVACHATHATVVGKTLVLALDAHVHHCTPVCGPALLHQHTAANIQNRAPHHLYMYTVPVLTAWPALSLTTIVACAPTALWGTRRFLCVNCITGHMLDRIPL